MIDVYSGFYTGQLSYNDLTVEVGQIQSYILTNILNAIPKKFFDRHFHELYNRF